MRPTAVSAPAAPQAPSARTGGLRLLVRPLASIQGRMLLMFLLVILMAMLLVSALLLQQLQTYYLKDFTSQLTLYADHVGQAVAGNLAAGSAGSVQHQLDSFGPDPSRSVVVVGPQGLVVGTSSTGTPAVGGSLRDNEQVSACLAGRAQVQRWVDETTRERFVGVSEPILADGRLVGCAWARGTLDRIDQTLASIRVILLRTTAGALALVALITLFLARTITGPLGELTARARELAAGSFDRQIEVRGDDELGNLASMFNYLSLRLRETLDVISSEKRKADAILAHMADGIVAADAGGVVSLINPAAARLLGAGADSVGRPLTAVVPAAVSEAVSGGDGRAVRVDLPERGQVLIARVAELRGDAAEPAGWVIVFADATEQERLNAQRRDFVSNVSHELRTPLTAIKSYTESLLDGGLEEPATGRRFLGVILAETDRMVELIRDLLQLTELEPRRQPWRPHPFRLEDVGAEAIRRVEARVRSKGLALHLHREGATPPALGDPDRILQVLSNLLANAIDFTPTGGQITIRVGPSPDGVACRVTDTGVGIPAQDLPHVFERLYRVEASRAREHGGTGLGLSIAKEIVEAHGGEIWIHSTVGEGTEVGFTLPAAAPGESA